MLKTYLSTLLKKQNGFTMVMVMAVVVITGITLGLTAQSWRMVMKREREKELLFRGSQIKEAIECYRRQNVVMPLDSLDDLVNVRRNPPIRRLRRLYEDPMTGKADWRLIKDQYGICGVASSSDEEPLKISFSNISSLSGFEGAQRYSEWEFVSDEGNDHSKTYNSYHEGL